MYDEDEKVAIDVKVGIAPVQLLNSQKSNVDDDVRLTRDST